MSLNAKTAASGGMKFDPLPAATYPARLVQVIDMGLQPQRAFQGKEKDPAYEIMLTYEFVDEFLKDEDGQDMTDKPRWLSETMPLYNLSAEKAKSTTRYNALDPTGARDGDFSALVGTPCLVTIVQNPGKTRVYENITAVAGMREKDAKKCPALVNAPRTLDLDDPDPEVFLALPSWVQDKIKKGLEYEGSTLQRLLMDGTPAKVADEGTESDDIPF